MQPARALQLKRRGCIKVGSVSRSSTCAVSELLDNRTRDLNRVTDHCAMEKPSDVMSYGTSNPLPPWAVSKTIISMSELHLLKQKEFSTNQEIKRLL